MKQILEYLKIKKLGTPVLPPFEKFEGLMAAKVLRRNSESFVVAKWNDDFLTPDVAFDPNANFGMVDEFLELYEIEKDGHNSETTDKVDEDSEVDDEVDTDPNLDKILELNTTEKLEVEEKFPIFETLKSDELSEWLLDHKIIHKPTISKPEKVKLCEDYVLSLDKSE